MQFNRTQPPKVRLVNPNRAIYENNEIEGVRGETRIDESGIDE